MQPKQPGSQQDTTRDQNPMQPPRAGQDNPDINRPEEEEEEESGGRQEEDEEGSEPLQSPGAGSTPGSSQQQ